MTAQLLSQSAVSHESVHRVASTSQALAAAPIALSVFAASTLVSGVSLRTHELLTTLGQYSVALAYVALLPSLSRPGYVRRQMVFGIGVIFLMILSLLPRVDDYADFNRRFLLTVLVLLPALWATANDHLTSSSAGYALGVGMALPPVVNLVDPGPLVTYLSSNTIADALGLDSAFVNYAGLSRAFGAAALVLLVLAFKGPVGVKAFAAVTSVVFALLCASAGGRAQLLAMLLVSIVLIVGCGVGRQLFAVTVPLIGAGLVVANALDISAVRGVVRILSVIETRSSASRFPLWAEAWSYVTANPRNLLFGGGATGFSVNGGDSIGYTPHNLVLEVAAIWGIVVAGALVGLLVVLVVQFARSTRYSISAGETVMFALVVYFLVTSGTSSSLFQSPITFIVLALAVRFAVIEPPAKSQAGLVAE